LSDNPESGGVGHALATVLRVDPERQLDDDLLRMKTFIETGEVPSDVAWQSPRGVDADEVD
jgi:hypothetical protein